MDLRLLLTLSLIGLQNVSAYTVDRNFWESSAPGRLLKALDSMTLDEAPPDSVAATTTSESVPKRRRATRKSPSDNPPPPAANERVIVSDDQSGAADSAEADDYDGQYERFVHEYFDDAADHYLSDYDDDDGGSGEASNLSGEVSAEIDSSERLDAVPYASGHKSEKNPKEKNCRKEHRKREVCWICKNPRNGERSETCSFEHSSEPESFAYETQRKYRTTRDRDVSDSEEEGSSSKEEAEAESKTKINAVKPESPFNATAPKSSCTKRTFGGKSCYYCKDAIGTKAIKCFDLIPRATAGGGEEKQQKRRIYKRTLSYVYEKGLGPNEEGLEAPPAELDGAPNISAKLINNF